MKFFQTLLFVALPCAVFAQSNYHEGYVVKNNGDTLKGYIDAHEWSQNPRSINFKKNESDRQAVNFSPQAVKAFGLTGADTYIAYNGLISMDKNRFPDLPFAVDTTKKSDTIFLKQLVTGKYLKLFYHQDAVKTRFFVAETDTQPVELKYYQYYDSANQLEIKAFYKGQLTFYINKYMPGNAKLARDADEAKFNQADLEKIVLAINGDTAQAKKSAYIRFFIGGGINNIKSRLQDYEPIGVFTQVGPVTEVAVYPETISKYSTTISPRIDLGIDLFNNPNVQKLIFRAEMSLSYNNPRFEYIKYGGGTTNITETYSFDQYSATLTPQLVLNLYNKDNFKLFLNGGVGVNFSSYSNTMLSKGSASDLSSIWMNFPVGAGIVINKKIELSFTYALPESLLNDVSSTFNVTSQYMCFGVKYLFSAQ
ncbi:MAG: hypothetical protein JSU01_17330 [Bacteroidetes bacterium]|nr:hypothetical protein [Bacteroidota bacterium]